MRLVGEQGSDHVRAVGQGGRQNWFQAQKKALETEGQREQSSLLVSSPKRMYCALDSSRSRLIISIFKRCVSHPRTSQPRTDPGSRAHPSEASFWVWIPARKRQKQRKNQFWETLLNTGTSIHLPLRKYFNPHTSFMSERKMKEVEFSHRDMHRSNLGSRTTEFHLALFAWHLMTKLYGKWWWHQVDRRQSI